MPIEIWVYIFKFLTISDIFKFKFLSKASNSLYFSVGAEFGVDFLVDNAKKIFDPKEYYNCLKYFFVTKLVDRLKEKFNFVDLLFIRYSLENFLRMTTISNTLKHLFYCPRSFFAASDCKLCSRLFIKKNMLVFPFPNFTILNRETVILEKKYDFNFFWVDENQKDIINSDMKRCLNNVVIQESTDFLVYFIEIQGRYYCNFFKCLSDFLPVNKAEKIYLLEFSSELFNSYLCYILRHINLTGLKSIFEQVNVNQFPYLKVINKKYKEYLKDKYES